MSSTTDFGDLPNDEKLFVLATRRGDARNPLLGAEMVIAASRLLKREPERYAELQNRLAGWSSLSEFKKRVQKLRAEADAKFKRKQDEARIEALTAKDGLVRDAKGQIESSAQNIRTAIERLGVRLSYDSFRGNPVVEGLEGFGPLVDDAALDRLYLSIEERFGYLPPDRLFRTVASDMCMQNRFHPVREELEWFQCLWDGKPRLDTWLIDYAVAADTPINRAVGAIVMIAAVRRVRKPGTKFDEMLVLESAEQGMNKSSLVAAMAIKEEWFSDSVPLNADDKVMIERTSGKWILEVAELAGMRKGEVERIRAQLSRTHDRARLAYARLPAELPRQSIMIGTTNADRVAPYLADIFGNRRFWPVEVGRCDVAAFVRDREQLWAEAAAREAAGESIRLPEHLWAAAAVEQDSRAVGNSFVEELAPHLGERDGLILAQDVWQLLRIPVERRDPLAGKFGKAMKSLGWERVRKRLSRGQPPIWCYRRGGSGVRLLVERDMLGHAGFMVRRAGEVEETTEG